MTDMVEKVARAIAAVNDSLEWEKIPQHKPEWNKAGGMFDGEFRDINEPFQYEYEDMARAAINALMEPTDEMLKSGYSLYEDRDAGQREIWQAMLKAALDD